MEPINKNNETEAPKPAMPQPQQSEGPMPRPSYKWTEKKDRLIIQLLKKDETSKQIAEGLNEKFPDGVRADEVTVDSRLSNKIYKENNGLKRRFTWTDEKDALVIQFLQDSKTVKQIAEALNARFPDGPRANRIAVASRLTSRIYKGNSNLRKHEKYMWTEEKDNLVIQLIQEDKTHQQIAESLNEKFQAGPNADEMTVRNRLIRNIYKKHGDLKQRYDWTEEKDQLVILLLQGGCTNRRVADALNELFPGGQKADSVAVRYRLTYKIYRGRKDLRKHEKYRWVEEKDQLVIQSIRDGKTREQIAEALNEKFIDGPRADWQTVANRLQRTLYKRYPDILDKNVEDAKQQIEALLRKYIEQGGASPAE